MGYSQRVSALSDDRLEQLHYLKPETSAIIRAFRSKRLEWLCSVDVNALIRLRQENRNEEFRHLLSTSIDRLHQSDMESVDRVAGEICHELDVEFAKHQRDLQAIQDKYNNLHGQTLILAGGACLAMAVPLLAPVLGTTAPFGLAAKYAKEKKDERREKKQLTQSMIGILATARPAV
jgi:hypothetical protein